MTGAIAGSRVTSDDAGKSGPARDAGATVAPHFLQNLAPNWSGAAQETQVPWLVTDVAKDVPHDLQNLTVSLLSVPHFPQLAINPPDCRKFSNYDSSN
jgi:hypothetical protein